MARCNPAIPPVPQSRADLVAIFGNLPQYVRADGTLSPTWEAEKITRITLPKPIPYAYGGTVSRITVHNALRVVAVNLFAEIWDSGLADALGPYGGGFVYRPNRNNAAAISLHAWGIAWDFDPAGFPNGSKKKRNPELVALFERWGFFCGQNFKGTPDAMHFQYAEKI